MCVPTDWNIDYSSWSKRCPIDGPIFKKCSYNLFWRKLTLLNCRQENHPNTFWLTVGIRSYFPNSNLILFQKQNYKILGERRIVCIWQQCLFKDKLLMFERANVWMGNGGSIQILACSNIGHSYRAIEQPMFELADVIAIVRMIERPKFERAVG